MHKLQSIARATEAEIVILKSRFIARLFPIESEAEAKAKLAEVKSQNRDARHNVYAYRLGSVERLSDDGEPSGTAGRPVLEVLRREDLDNILAVVTRYFGGILLGAGGLIRAYAQSVKAGLDAATRICLVPYHEVIVDMEYALVNLVEHEAALCDYAKASTEYATQVRAVYLVPEAGLVAFMFRLKEISAGQIEAQVGHIVLRAENV
ncbi:MAG: IMPACT family protein [Peptococcaceae bacterium]|nr:IMPACT family protein [Peptococcaceae bacterium]